MKAHYYEELLPDSFTWDRYCGTLDVWPNDVWNDCEGKPREGTVVLGYMDGDRLRCRPREEAKAVLVETRDGMIVWFHVYYLPDGE
jgi:hypothetical protein